MALTTSVTLGTFIDRALLDLQGPVDIGRSAVQATGCLTAVTSDNTLTLVDGSGINVSDLIEFDAELLLVTAKTADLIPIITVQRGYDKSVLATHTVGVVGLVNPMWSRMRVGEAVKRSFTRLEAMGVPKVTSGAYFRVAGQEYVILPADVRQVYSVRFMTSTATVGVDTGHLYELDRWKFQDDLPLSVYSTGKLLQVGWYVADTDQLIVTYRQPYRWSTWPADPTEASTMSVPEGAEELPSAYAAAWMTSRREIARTQLARAQEWNEMEPIRNGVSLSLIRSLWAEFYRSLSEAQRVYQPPTTRVYRKFQRL